MTTLDIEQTTARVIAMAREAAGATAAEFDYGYAVSGTVAQGWADPIMNAIWLVANEGRTGSDDPIEEMEQRAFALRDQLMPELERYVAKCRRRQFVGWAGGTIRYAGWRDEG